MIHFPWRRREGARSAVEQLRSGHWDCTGCEGEHSGMIDLAAFAPDPWPGPSEYEPNSALRTEGDFLSEDFCVIDGHYFFARCVLEIPVHGLAEKFGFGCWSTLSRQNFDRYIGGFDGEGYGGQGPWSSWLCNRLFDHVGDAPLACWMYPQLARQRPTLAVADPEHPLAAAQADGISAEQVLAIYRHYGHGDAT